jgi:esterase/lipase
LQKAGELKTVIEDGNAEVANASIQKSMYFDTTTRLAISHEMWTFDAKTPEYLQKNMDYTLNNVIEKIKCPTLVLEAEMDDAFSGGPQKVYNALRCPKKHILFS